jgi:hypothetical protein
MTPQREMEGATDTEESKKSLELGPIGDIEDGKQSEKDGIEGSAEPGFQRPMTNLRWLSVCVGLYLTALLYGRCQ